MKLPGTGPGSSSLFSLDSMGWAVAFRLGGASIVSTVESHLLLVKELWLAVDEIVHHDDVVLLIVVRPGATLPAVIRTDAMRASSNWMPKKDRLPSPGEAGTKLLNTSVPFRSKYSMNVLPPFDANPDAICLINICEHSAEASDCCRDSAIGTRYGKNRFGDVAPHRSEQPRPAERPEDFGIARIAKKHRQSALESARGRSLRKPQPGCFVLAASGVQEHDERIYRGCRVQKVGVATVPVDLAPTL